jgi:uncharacterized protein YjbJ (UPF0337 family)
MTGRDKARARRKQVTGTVKENAGEAVGNERLAAEGRGEKASGDARQAREKAKDAVKDVFKD